MLVHAGAPGQLDKDGNVIPAYRLHRYLMPIGSDIEVAYENGKPFVPTFPVENPSVGLHLETFSSMFFDRSKERF